MKKITAIIPCYNEADGIGDVVRKLPAKKLRSYGFELDILVIDNNSKDNTSEVAREAGARVVLERKQGKGNAIRTGFYSLAEDTDYVVMLDGDDTYRAEEVLRLIEPLDSGFADAILGSRMHGNIAAGSMPRLNRMGNQLYSSLVRSAYKIPVTDVLTGYYAWTADSIKELRQHLRSTDFAIEMEMVTKMARLGQRVYSVPISYDSRQGESSLSPVKDGYRILRMYLRNLTWSPELQIPTVRVVEALNEETTTHESQQKTSDNRPRL